MPRSLMLFALPLLLVACGSPGTPGPTPSPALNVTVSGKVLTRAGRPASFLPVLVGGKVTSTDASGSFGAVVASPYDLVVLQPDQKSAQIFQGVTRPDPIVLVFQNDSAAPRKATLKVNFTGTGSGTGLLDLSNPVGANVGVTGDVATAGTSYSTEVQWPASGPGTFQGNLRAVLTQNTGQVANAINAFGEADGVSVQDGQTTSATVGMAPVTVRNVSGSVSVPAGFTVASKTLGFVCGPGATFPSYPFTFDMGAASSFSYPAPVTASPLYVGASARQGDAFTSVQQYGVVAGGSALSLTLPTPPVLSAPASGAVGVAPSAPLSWTASDVGVSQLFLNPSTPGPLSISLVTQGSSTALPDLSALGYPIPRGVAYRWSVMADSRQPDVNSVLSGVPLNYLTNYSSVGSGNRQFTTAP